MSHSYDSWGNDSERFGNGTTCIGIDLGTTNSCVGVWQEGSNHVKIIKNKARNRTTPSVVHFDTDTLRVLVGEEAIEQETKQIGNTVRSVKRLMGQKFTSKAVELAKDMVNYKLVPTTSQNVGIQVVRNQGQQVVVEPEEVAACLLAELKESAEQHRCLAGQTVQNVVITVPAYFNDSQRQATLRGAQMAGFQGIRLLNEPTAAAMAYGLFVAGKKQVVVFDFGGGTLDVSLMQIEDGKFQVLAIGGDTNLGGEDLNQSILRLFLRNFCSKCHVASQDLGAKDLIRIRNAIEIAKKELSSQDKVEIVLENLEVFAKDTEKQRKAFRWQLDRATFEKASQDVFNRCMKILENVLHEADVEPSQVDEVVMVGGSTRIPRIRTLVSECFHGKELCVSVNADEVVCEGAAIQGAILSGIDSKVFRDVLMMDVIPLSIGLEKADGQMEVLLPKNSRIPTQLTKYFETYEDFQPGLTVEVYEGEEPVAQDNEHICYFNFPIARNRIGRKGEFRHPVTFTMNANGVLQVQAGIHHDDHQDDDDEAIEFGTLQTTKSFLLLGFYLLVLFGLYVYFRIYFAEIRSS